MFDHGKFNTVCVAFDFTLAEKCKGNTIIAHKPEMTHMLLMLWSVVLNEMKLK